MPDRSAAPSFAVLATLLMLGAMALFAAGHGLVRYASAELHPFQIGFLRAAFGLAFLLPLIARGPDYSDLRVRLPKMHLIRGALSGATTLVWFSALAMMPLGEAVALNFTAPLFATVMAAIFLRETVRARRWAATVVGFVGVLIVIRPGIETVQLGALLALASAMAISVNVLMVRVMAQVDSTRSIVFSFSLLNAAFTLPPALLFWIWPSATMIAVTAAIGITTTVGHLMLTRAMRLAEASALIPLDFVRLPLSALIGFVWFAEVPDAWTAAGALIIGVSAVYIARREALAAKPGPAPGAT